MLRKLTVASLVVGLCLVGVTSALAVKYNEAPMLRVKVAAGELPPVEERLPEEPMIKKVVEEIGQYGGTLHAFGVTYSEDEEDDMCLYRAQRACLLDVTMDGTIIGNLAKGYELSDDGKSFTLYLREGAKWSDGYPFTADDILFMYEDIYLNEHISDWGTGFEYVSKMEKLDDYTVHLELDQPNFVLPLLLAYNNGRYMYCFAPKHYLKKWHIKYNPDADQLAKEEGFDSWYDCFYYHWWFNPLKDLDQPTMNVWVPKAYTGTAKAFERNPYFYQVDEEGNQLPYIDRVVVGFTDTEGYQLKIISGEADLAICVTSLSNYPLYKEHEEEGGYRVIPVASLFPSELFFGVQQNNPDPFLGGLLRDVRFRQALSVAINREEINEICYFGLGTPLQATVHPSASYYKEEWGKAYAQYDPDLANRLLDEIGLTERDKDGFRVNPDGQPIVMLAETYFFLYPDLTPFELVKEYWENVGIKMMFKDITGAARHHALNRATMSFQFSDVTETATYCYGGTRVMPDGVANCHEWANWLDANYNVSTGKRELEDFEGGKLPGEEPPEHVKQQYQRRNQIVQTKYRSKEYMQIAQEIWDYQAKYLYIIGTVGLVPQIVIVKKNLKNVPEVANPNMERVLSIQGESSQFFWKQ